jgi:hypothetical protein
MLFVKEGASLPCRCIKCNSNGFDVQMVTKTFQWKPAYAIALGRLQRLVPVRETTLRYGVCAAHRQSAGKSKMLGIGLIIAGCAEPLVTMQLEKPMWSLLGLGTILAGAVVCAIGTTISPASVPAEGVTGFKGAGRAFLEALDEWRG